MFAKMRLKIIGNSKVIFTSKIRKITAIIRKYIYISEMALFLESKPFSKGEDL